MLKKILTMVAALVFMGLATVSAQVPQVISYQGRVAVDGFNFDGTGRFRFALVDATGTTTYWSNDGTSVAGSEPTAAVTLPVVKGLYSVLLGDAALPNMTAIPTAAFQNADVRLRVWFDDSTNASQLLAPDQRIVAVAYAVVAGSVADGAVTAAKIAPGAVGATQLASNAVQAANVASGQVVKSLNGLTDTITLSAGPNVTLTPTGNTLTIAAANQLLGWPGSTSLTTLGTVSTGAWAATAIDDSFIASASAWNAKQNGNATLTSLSGKALLGTGDIVLSTSPALTTPLLTNPSFSGATDRYTVGNGFWWSTAVPYFQPNVAGGLAFDIMAKGPAGGDCWIDICSTDVVASLTPGGNGAFEALNLTKRAGGPCFIGWNGGGTSALNPRSLMLQSLGGFVGIGKPFSGGISPLSLLHVAASGESAGVTVSSTGDGQFSSLRGYHARGTSASSSPSLSDDILFFIGTHGRDNAGYRGAADSGIFFRATENFTDTAHGTRISIQTTTNATVSRVERLGIDTDVTVGTGNLVLATVGKGLVYKGGANARAGNVALVAGAATVTNSTVTANSLVMITRRTAGGTLGQLTCVPAAGSFTITSTSATETSVISYQVIETN